MMKLMNVARASVQLKGLLVMKLLNVARATCSVEGLVGDEVDEHLQSRTGLVSGDHMASSLDTEQTTRCFTLCLSLMSFLCTIHIKD